MSEETETGAWYAEPGSDNDVVLASRVRLARNLTQFCFPASIKSDDAERVQSLVFDAFNHLPSADRFQMVRMSNIDSAGRKILAERGVISSDSGFEPWRAVLVRNDGVVSATVNMEDHLRLAVFRPGFNFESAWDELDNLDGDLQHHLRFSALADFGYLSQNFDSVGTGLRVSALVSLPALSFTGVLERVIRDLMAQGFLIRGYYGFGGAESLGALYQLSNMHCAEGSAASQLSRMDTTVRKIIELERKSREELLNTMPTTIEDIVYRAVVVARYARFIQLNEGVELVSRIKLALNLGLVQGVDDSTLTALLYRVQPAHLNFVLSGGSIIIEDDVQGEDRRVERLRAIIIQEVLKQMDIRERKR